MVKQYDALLTRSCFLCNGREGKIWVQASFIPKESNVMICLPVHQECLIEHCKSDVLKKDIKELWRI